MNRISVQFRQVFLVIAYSAGVISGCGGMYLFQKYNKKIDCKRISNEKQYLNVMHQWFILKERGLPLSDLLRKYNIDNVAVYGMGIIGRHVVRELEGSGIVVSYGIDQKNIDSYKGVDVFTPKDPLQAVDAVINTVVWSHEEIRKLLGEKMDVLVLSLEDLVFDRYGLH